MGNSEGKTSLLLMTWRKRVFTDTRWNALTVKQTTEALDRQNAELAAKIGIKGIENVTAFKDYFLEFCEASLSRTGWPLDDLPDGLPK
jgi:hypothetical protein